MLNEMAYAKEEFQEQSVVYSMEIFRGVGIR